jgi:hypothetical protein
VDDCKPPAVSCSSGSFGSRSSRAGDRPSTGAREPCDVSSWENIVDMRHGKHILIKRSACARARAYLRRLPLHRSLLALHVAERRLHVVQLHAQVGDGAVLRVRTLVLCRAGQGGGAGGGRARASAFRSPVTCSHFAINSPRCEVHRGTSELPSVRSENMCFNVALVSIKTVTLRCHAHTRHATTLTGTRKRKNAAKRRAPRQAVSSHLGPPAASRASVTPARGR